jgi:NADH-quinone oxidoreductase subunit L
MTTIMWVGGATAFFSACLAFVEHDLKRILAYSTLSQLGYMVMALGLGGSVAGMYHLTTHAFFKALLFLAAGSVIHGTHEQDIRKLGGLMRSMPWTSAAFFIGGLALCGFPGLAGFFSKDEILVLAHERNTALYWLGTVTAGMTAFYIARAWFVAFTPPLRAGFTGKSRGHAHESPPVMVWPLMLLAALSLTGGYVGIPRFLDPHAHGELSWPVAITSLLVVAIGLGLAWLIYQRKVASPQQVVNALALPYTFLQRRYYIDECYAWYVAAIQQTLIAGLCAWVERYVIIGLLVNGTAWLTRGMGRILRLCQTGKVQTYVLGFLIGVVWLLTSSLRR